MAGTIVRDLALGQDDTERLATAKDKLWKNFSNRLKSVRQMLEKLMEGEPFAISYFEGIRGFLINLLTPYYRAERKG
jgi:hypothetical protein